MPAVLALVVFILLVFLYVVFVKYIAIPVGLAAAGIGALMGIGAAVHEFGKEMLSRVRERGGADQQPVADEPAFRGYLFGPVLVDLRRSIMHTADALRHWVTLPLGLAAMAFSSFRLWILLWPVAIAGVLGALSGAIAGFVTLVAVTLVAGAVLLPTVGIALATGWVLQSLERLVARVRRAHLRCDDCHTAFEHPTYLCPGCGAQHTRLRPNTLGISVTGARATA
ncbi:MAG: hypothetical protein ACR2NB_03720 [Solirubrobacteraceae bacterium]